MSSIVIKDERFSNVEKQLAKMSKRAEEFCQSRSKFQIEKFIACEEYTDITRFRHVAHNSYVAMQEVRRSLIERERLNRKIQVLADKQKEAGYLTIDNADLDIYEASRKLDEIDIRIKGSILEIEYMEKICDHLESQEIEKTGTGFTAEKLEANEAEYWELRLSNQMHCAQISATNVVGEGNYKSLLNACETPILPDSTNQIPKIPLELNELAAYALIKRDGVREKFLEKVPSKEITN